MPMQQKFFVVDGDNNISWSAKTDAGESFKTKSNAFQHARLIAQAEPGKPVHVVQTVEIVICEVSAPKRITTYK